MKKIVLSLVLVILLAPGVSMAKSTTEGMSAYILVENGVDSGNTVEIEFYDVGASYYYFGFSCEQGVSAEKKNGELNSDCATGKGNPEVIYPTGDPIITIDNYYFINSTEDDKQITFSISARDSNGSIIDSDSFEFEVKGANLDLNLSVNPDDIESGEEPVIKWNNVGADYYILSASCKDGFYTEGKARSNLCLEGEKIYPTDNIRVDDISFVSTKSSKSSLVVEVSAWSNGSVISNDSEYLEISPEDDDDFASDFAKWGDIRFKNPKEGQSSAEEIKAGSSYTIKWENIVKAEWTDVHLYKYKNKPSNDYLRNGPTNVSIGTKILDFGTAYLGQKSMIVDLPSYLEDGYYYFRFGGKAAGDSSPAIEIVSEDDDSDKQNVKPNGNDNSGKDLSNEQVLAIVESMYGKDSKVYTIISILILLELI